MYTYAPFFFIYSVSNICSNVANFPAKRLRKNTAPKIRIRQCFKKNITNKVDIYWRVVFLYSHLLLLNKEIGYILLSFKRPQKFRMF